MSRPAARKRRPAAPKESEGSKMNRLAELRALTTHAPIVAGPLPRGLRYCSFCRHPCDEHRNGWPQFIVVVVGDDRSEGVCLDCYHVQCKPCGRAAWQCALPHDTPPHERCVLRCTACREVDSTVPTQRGLCMACNLLRPVDEEPAAPTLIPPELQYLVDLGLNANRSCNAHAKK
jgi:hypothetical protein